MRVNVRWEEGEKEKRAKEEDEDEGNNDKKIEEKICKGAKMKPTARKQGWKKKSEHGMPPLTLEPGDLDLKGLDLGKIEEGGGGDENIDVLSLSKPREKGERWGVKCKLVQEC